MKTNVIWLHSHFLYWMGGTKYIYEVLRRLQHKYNVTVIVENASDYATDYYQKAGVKLINLDKMTSTNPFYWLTLPYQISNTYSRITKLSLPTPNVIVSSMFPMNVVATRLAPQPLQLCFEPFAFFHDPDYLNGFAWHKRFLIQMLKFIYSGLDVQATRKSSKLITLNQVTQRGMKKIYDLESVPVYAGIDTSHFHRFVSPSIRAQYQGKEIIIHSTDYSPVKGTDRMIRIFAKIKKSHPKAHLLITSTQPNDNAVAKYQFLTKSLELQNSVEFLGFVDYDILPQLYSLAKVLVQCSYSELSGTTSMALPVKEALACGTACIRSPVTTEDVKDGVTGYLVDPRDAKLMAKRIGDLLSLSESSYSKLSKLARASIIDKYSWDKTVSRISRIIDAYDQVD